MYSIFIIKVFNFWRGKNINKWKDILCFIIGSVIIVKMIILLKFVYKFSVILIIIFILIFIEIENFVLKFI